MNSIATQIESYLLATRTWVSAQELCSRFDLANPRALRAVGEKPPLCAEFAISNTRRGFKHIAYATPTEALNAYRARRRHGIGELLSARRMLNRWEKSTVTATAGASASAPSQEIPATAACHHLHLAPMPGNE